MSNDGDGGGSGTAALEAAAYDACTTPLMPARGGGAAPCAAPSLNPRPTRLRPERSCRPRSRLRPPRPRPPPRPPRPRLLHPRSRRGRPARDRATRDRPVQAEQARRRQSEYAARACVRAPATAVRVRPRRGRMREQARGWRLHELGVVRSCRRRRRAPAVARCRDWARAGPACGAPVPTRERPIRDAPACKYCFRRYCCRLQLLKRRGRRGARARALGRARAAWRRRRAARAGHGWRGERSPLRCDGVAAVLRSSGRAATTRYSRRRSVTACRSRFSASRARRPATRNSWPADHSVAYAPRRTRARAARSSQRKRSVARTRSWSLRTRARSSSAASAGCAKRRVATAACRAATSGFDFSCGSQTERFVPLARLQPSPRLWRSTASAMMSYLILSELSSRSVARPRGFTSTRHLCRSTFTRYARSPDTET